MLTTRMSWINTSRKRAWLSASSPARVVPTIWMGVRDRTATPLYAFCVTAALSYPRSLNSSAGKIDPFSSCNKSTSTGWRCSQAVTCRSRARIELTFQLAILIIGLRQASNPQRQLCRADESVSRFSGAAEVTGRRSQSRAPETMSVCQKENCDVWTNDNCPCAST